MAQVVERRIGSAEVTGPTPVASLCKLGETGHDLTGFLFDRKFLRNYLSNKNLSEGSHCGGWVAVARCDPPQAVNPAKQDSFLFDKKYKVGYSNNCKSRQISYKLILDNNYLICYK